VHASSVSAAPARGRPARSAIAAPSTGSAMIGNGALMYVPFSSAPPSDAKPSAEPHTAPAR
jgi:hypothetical protein